MTHTPPPWEILYAGEDDMSQAECIAEEMPVVSIGPINYCEFSADSLGHSEGIQKEYADAHLIKASPELLEAAKELERVVRLGIPQEAVHLIEGHGLWDEFVAARIHIEEAIATAEDRS